MKSKVSLISTLTLLCLFALAACVNAFGQRPPGGGPPGGGQVEVTLPVAPAAVVHPMAVRDLKDNKDRRQAGDRRSVPRVIYFLRKCVSAIAW